MSARQRAAALAAIALLVPALGCRGRDQEAGAIEGATRPPAVIERAAAAQDATAAALAGRAAGAAAPEKQILFGDLHVHTTYSLDAFLYALPLFGGEGVHPPADACDFARYCAAVDFFALTDHAESLTPERWERTLESLRQCDARAGGAENPDLVVFAGFEWTQVGATPEDHFGHKNVIYPSLGAESLPLRPITALDESVFAQTPSPLLLRGLQLLAPFGLQPYADMLWLIERLAKMPNCPDGVDTRELPSDCRENAADPEALFEKLAQWDLESIVIPHGLTWGLHVPLGARLDNQLTRRRHDPDRQFLLEVYSGHGNSEEFRGWSGVVRDADGRLACPEPNRDFLPCCWRAGEIMRQRCGDLPAAECEARVEEARRLALEANAAPHLVFPDTEVEDWLDCDQCRDCFKPTFAPRPGMSAQYALALSNNDETDAGGAPLRFRWGLVGSSDDHRSQPGTGYKQRHRRHMTDAHGVRSPLYEGLLRATQSGADPSRPQRVEREQRSIGALLEVERVASFLYPGGLVAAHAVGRSREAIWDALRRREVYGTSGPRILLWFDLVNAVEGRRPMGSEVVMNEAPRFEVRAAGSFVEQPGCPAESRAALSPERLELLCRGECHHPGDERQRIERIEVVRIRPQSVAGEEVGELIEDPWLSHECAADAAGCVFAFEDADFVESGHDAVYYVRALQEPTMAINAANYRTEFDDDGEPVRITPCSGSYRTEADDDCLAPVRERAWSSPIFVDRAGGGGSAGAFTDGGD